MNTVALTFSDAATAQKVLATPSLLKIQNTKGTSSARSTVTYYKSLTAGSDSTTLLITFYERFLPGTTYYFSYDGGRNFLHIHEMKKAWKFRCGRC